MHLRIKSVHRKVLKWTDDEVYVDIRVFPNWILKMKITKIAFYKFYRFCRILSLVILKMKITKNSPNSIDSVDSLKFNSIKLKFLTPNDRYKAGMLKAKVDDPETVQLIEGAGGRHGSNHQPAWSRGSARLGGGRAPWLDDILKFWRVHSYSYDHRIR